MADELGDWNFPFEGPLHVEYRALTDHVTIPVFVPTTT